MRLQIGLIVILRHKTDFLAIRLMRYRKMVLLRQFPCMYLGIAPKRHEKMLQRLLIQMVERIRLILLHIDALCQHVPSGSLIMENLRIMPGCHIIRPHLPDLLQQPLKLHITIAGHTGIRRPPPRILCQKIIDDAPLKKLPEIDHIMRYSNDLRYPPGIVN